MSADNANPSGHLESSDFFGLADVQIVATSFYKLVMSFPTFHFGYPSVIS